MAYGNSGHLYEGEPYPRPDSPCDEWCFRIETEEKKKGPKIVGLKKVLKIERLYLCSTFGNQYVQTIYSSTITEEGLMERLMEFVSTDRPGKVSLDYGIDLEFSRTKFGFKADDGSVIKLYKKDYVADLESIASKPYVPYS